MGRKVDWLKGVVVPVCTPFDEKEDVDEDGLRGLVDFLIDKGVHCLFPLGGTSEFYRLSLEERKRVIDTVIDQTNDRIPVTPGAHTLSTKLSIEMAKYAEDAGADAVTVLQPYFDETPEDRLLKHYSDISESVDIPIFLYAEQGVVNELSLELISEIADLDDMIGIKLSTNDICRFQRGLELFGDKIAVLVGIEEVFVPGLVVGCAGGVIGNSNFCPEYWVEMYNRFLKGDIKGALELQNKFSKATFDLIAKYGYREVIKEALNLRGIKVGRPRRPGGEISDTVRPKIVKMLEEMKLV